MQHSHAALQLQASASPCNRLQKVQGAVINPGENTSCFLRSASDATTPASEAANVICDGTKVSGQVASHTNAFPSLQGTTIAPSGLLPSQQNRPTGSRWLGTLVESKDLLMMSLIAKCQAWRPLQNRQAQESPMQLNNEHTHEVDTN